MTKTYLAPVPQSGRIALLDVLRGFALLGILLVNFWGDSGTLMPSVDAFMGGVLDTLLLNSFYPLFSFLFGVGAAMQLARVRARGTNPSFLYLRRLLVLFLIGTLHAVFIWNGDILASYAITGLVFIPMQYMRQTTILGVAALLFLAMLNEDTLRTDVDARRGVEPELSSKVVGGGEQDEERPGVHNGAIGRAELYVLATSDRARRYVRNLRGWGNWINWAFSETLLCFLIGFVTGRSDLMSAAPRPRILLAVAAASLAASAAGLMAGSLLELPIGWLRSLCWFAENFCLTVFYVTAIILIYTFTEIGGRVLGVFAKPGRMALSIYLMQSAAMTALGLPYGFGWKPATTTWIAVHLLFFFGIQIPFSGWWLARFQFGPVEWIWRSLTYGRVQPMVLLPRSR